MARKLSTISRGIVLENIVGSNATYERLRRAIGQGERLTKALLGDLGR